MESGEDWLWGELEAGVRMWTGSGEEQDIAKRPKGPKLGRCLSEDETDGEAKGEH